MSISVVEDKTVNHGSTSMTVVLQSDKPEELTTRETRDRVIVEARLRGFPARGHSSIPSSYPVDKDGDTDDELILGKRPVAAYRADYTVSAGLG